LYDYNIRSYEQQKAILEEKIAKQFPVIIAELDGVVVGFGMYSEFRFREAYKFTVEHSVYVMIFTERNWENITSRINSTGKKNKDYTL
jgi:L-amino acid N-acyltransferase YncA